jgi:ankyrin repeat protein
MGVLQYGLSALHCASYAGETECVKVLLKYGAQVDLPVRCDVMYRNGSRVEVFCLGKLGNWFNCWG